MTAQDNPTDGEVPRTFRPGPNGPAVFADGSGPWGETLLAAPVEGIREAVEGR